MITREHHNLHAHIPELPDGIYAVFLHGIRYSDHTRHTPTARCQHRRFPLLRKKLCLGKAGFYVDPAFRHERFIAKEDRFPFHNCGDATPRQRFKLLRIQERDSLLCRICNDRIAQRMLAALLR